MDPRSQATSADLNEQQRLGLEIFFELRTARKALAEIGAVKKQLIDAKSQLTEKNPELLTQVASIEKAITAIKKPGQSPIPAMGLEAASTGLASALRVVEGGDRTVPSQAIELYHQSDEASKAGMAAWTNLKSTQLVELNNALQKAGVKAIQISEIQAEAGNPMSE